MKIAFVAAAVVTPFLVCTSAWADIVVSLGNLTSGFTSGQTGISSASVATAQSGQLAPFGGPCGNPVTDCSTSWTFDYSIPSGQTISGATLTLGIYNIDPVGTSGNSTPVLTYALAGGDDLTASLNTVADGLNAGAGSTNKEFDVLSITIPSTSFALLDGGVATIDLTLQGPGVGVLGPTTHHSAGPIFSTLDLQTTGINGNVPEPSMLYILLTGIGAMALMRVRHSKSS